MSPLFGPTADAVRDRGQEVAGVVTGLEVTSTHDEDVARHFLWAIDAGGTRYGIRQELSPYPEVRLGMPVSLRAGLAVRSVAMGLGAAIDANVRVQSADRGSYDGTIANVGAVPGYASHLPIVGAVLPAWEAKGMFGSDKLLVDWPAAAMADPGVGKPSVVPKPTGGLMGALGGAFEKMQSDSAAVSQTEPEIPDYAKGLMKKFGVDPDDFKSPPPPS